MTAAAELIGVLQMEIWLGFAVFLRVGATIALLPGFGEQSVPVRIKLVIAIAFTLVVAPAAPGVLPDFTINAMVVLAMTETIAGVLIGLGIRLFVLALQTAGAIAAQSTSLSQILGGAAIEPLPAMGYILTVGAIALAVLAGLHVKAAQLLIHSYVLLPMGLFASGSDVADWGLDQIAYAFELAFLLAAPFLLMSALYNLALGVINKAMPQLMVAFVGAPVITLGGLFLLFLATPIMLSVWLSALDQFMASPFEARR
ncbi:flagellar biosynthetic protein FliR [Tateyamaria omphalii]|uniref:flagellar biosynthetic protein FliR n=1 Tax=Tateyamaria omphalii TaxID=299262 RepID=UPI001C98F67B|nr:flagellar biosynthetic protein FliR [Tateyamaria omphalii]MBY5933630.1 flagellar biosynthetic protein FliR [Tateyamaria omphalii]